MNLNRVTITGADDTTPISFLVELAKEFPFLELGILVSRSQEGTPRFPGRDWISLFSKEAEAQKLNVSTHVCGAWVRQMFTGDLRWIDLPDCADICQRIQINTHAEPHVSTLGLFSTLAAKKEREFIFQWDGVNDHLAYAAHAFGLNTSALFDTSGGAGILPNSWPVQHPYINCGYAGGLGPANVVEQLRKLEPLTLKPYWIDMERRVRTPDDQKLDLNAVRSVLKSVQKMMRDNGDAQ